MGTSPVPNPPGAGPTVPVNNPIETGHTTKGQIVDTVLHDVIAAGILAAALFVKNPASQGKAASLIQAVQSLLPLLDNQLQNH